MLKASLMCGEALSEQGVWGTQTLQIKERERMKTGPGLVLQDLFSERNYLAGVHMHGVWGWGGVGWCPVFMYTVCERVSVHGH